MTKPAPGNAVVISRGGYTYNVETGAEGDVDGILWLFSGGWANGDAGTYDVYAQAANDDTDDFEDTGIDVTVVANAKTLLPEAIFNVAGSNIKLVGAAGNVKLHGAG